ncbi:hypothetical protein BJX66DRAFT_336248 [Aspergillus keveii]|uniref:Aminoglycoside phosphotransferase domain-containing protein n=1 Tax=Aspergillus keveii TaxID=714993 RepID=A0ABR4GB30_9EURO
MDFKRPESPCSESIRMELSRIRDPLGAEYIIMEKQGGIVLTDVWDTLKGKQKVQILDQVVDMETRLAATKFSKFGSLYYKDDLPDIPNTNSPLYVDSTGKEVRSERFLIGSTNHRSFFDFGRDALDIDLGPCKVDNHGIDDGHCTEGNCNCESRAPLPLNARRSFLWTATIPAYAVKKISALESYLKVAPYVLPENEATHASVLWHGDLHSQNIFVDPEDPARITGIIDWQSVSAWPLFMQVGRPVFLDYNGPVPEELDKVDLPPNFDSMKPDEQRKAKALHTAQTLHNLYLVRGDGISSQIPFPLQFSDEETRLQEQDGDLWAQGVELMGTFIEDTDCFKHWDGRVTDLDYEESKKQLDEGIKRFLDREARTEDERDQWLKALPFVDQGGAKAWNVSCHRGWGFSGILTTLLHVLVA